MSARRALAALAALSALLPGLALARNDGWGKVAQGGGFLEVGRESGRLRTGEDFSRWRVQFRFDGVVPTGPSNAGHPSGIGLSGALGFSSRESTLPPDEYEIRIPVFLDLGVSAPFLLFRHDTEKGAGGLMALFGPRFAIGADEWSTGVMRLSMQGTLRYALNLGDFGMMADVQVVPFQASFMSADEDVTRLEWHGSLLGGINGYLAGVRVGWVPIRARGYYDSELALTGVVGGLF